MGAIAYRLRLWLRARRTGIAVLVAVVAVTAGIALGLLAGALRTLTASDRYSSWRGATYDVSLTQQSGPPRLAELRALPAIRRVDGATFVFGGLTPRSTRKSFDVLVFAGREGPLGTRLVEGRHPDPAHPGEFVANRGAVDAIGARLGDRFRLVTFNRAQAATGGFDAPHPAGPTLTATLVGVIDGPSSLQDGSDAALFPASLLDQGDIGTAATVMAASLAPGSSMADLRRQLDGLSGGSTIALDRTDWVAPPVRAAVSAQGQGLLVVALVVLVATVAVVGQFLSRQLRLDPEEGAALRSLGFRRQDAVIESVVRAVLVALAGVAVGAGLAYAASGLFPLDFVRHVEPHPGLRFDALALLVAPVGLAVALVLWVLVSLAVDARAGEAPVQPSSVAETVAAVVPAAQVSTALRFAFVRAGGPLRRARAPIVGLVVVFAVLYGALTFGANLGRLVDQPRRYGANFDLGFGQGGEVSAATVRRVAASRDVGAVTLFGTTSVTIGGTSVDLVGMRLVRGALVPDVLSGRLPQAADEIALGTLTARNLGLHEGDVVKVRGSGRARSLEVTGLIVVPTVGGADGVGKGALVVEQAMTDLVPEAVLNAGALRIRAGAPEGATGRIARAAGAAGLGQFDPPPSILNLGRVRQMPYLVAGSVGLLALLSLAHVMIVSVRRRRMDHAILRAVGATPRWLGGVVHWQATIITLVVAAFAVPIGTALGRELYRRLVDSIGARPDVLVPGAWLGAALAAIVVAANVVAAVPARRSRRDTPVRLLTRS